MSQITFCVDFSQSFFRGVNCPVPPVVTLEIDPSALTVAERELIGSRLDDAGVVRDRVMLGDSFSLHASPITTQTADLPGLLSAIAEQDRRFDERRTLAAKESAERVAQAVEIARRTPTLIESNGEIKPDWGDFYGYHYDDVRSNPHVRAYLARVEAMESARKAAKDQSAAADRDGWIAAHGSRRLRAIFAMGINGENTYRDERAEWQAEQDDEALAEQRPGWSYADDTSICGGYAGLGNANRVTDPTLRQIAIIRTAQKVEPSAKLVRLHADRIVAAAKFRGRTIIWPGE